MSHDSPTSADTSSHLDRPKPKDLREFSPRAIACGLFVAVLMGASYPYVVLKLGFGPNVSVVAAILGYVVLGLLFTGIASILGLGYRPYNRWENNIVQTGGTAAAQTAFMCILLAAFDMLADRKVVPFDLTLKPYESFAWLTAAGLLGVLLAVPLRRHYIVDEKLPFADGLAAGETILVCDSAGPVAFRAALAMLGGMAASALVWTLLAGNRVFELFDSIWLFGPALTRLFGPGLAVGPLMTTRVGMEWSLLAIGSGMIIGLRVNISMLTGTWLAWAVAPYALQHAGVLQAGFERTDVLFWVMWPATGMLVAGGLAALLVRWRVVARTFRGLTAATGEDEFPLHWTLIGVLLSGAALVAVQKWMLGQSVWITVTAILLSAPLALVGLRVLGETNWGPISSLSNMMQGIFALLAPGNVAANMVASGTTGIVASDSEAIMQDYKAGDMVGSSPRYLTYMQLLATPVGAAAVAWMYPLLCQQYGIPGKGALSAPTSLRWAGFAEILYRGAEALPRGALPALLIGAALGVVLAVLEALVRNKTWIPSPTGLGIGMLMPAAVIFTMVIGGVIGALWTRVSRRTSDAYQIPLASGLIAGEALAAVIASVVLVMLEFLKR